MRSIDLGPLAVGLALVAVTMWGCDEQDAAPFAVTVVPIRVDDAIPGQQLMLVASIAAEADNGGGVRVTGRTIDAYAGDVTIDVPADPIAPGESADIRVVAGDLSGTPPGAATPPTGMPEAIGPDPRVIPLTLTFTRGDQTEEITAHIQVSGGEDTVAPYAAELRDRFVTWLAEAHPELGIDASTAWSGSVVKPHWLVVTHYLWFSDRWEMGLMWHVMVPPYDWTRIYLRPRDGPAATHAFEIASVSDAALQPVEVEIPAELDR